MRISDWSSDVCSSDLPAPQKLDEISLTAVVLRSGEAILLHPESPSDAKRFGGVMVGTTPVEWLGVPMHSQARTIGVLAVQSYDPAVRFSEGDKALLQFVSTQEIGRAHV